MKRIVGFSIASGLMIGLGLIIGCQPNGPKATVAEPIIAVPAEDIKALVEGNNQFAIDLYKQLAKKEGNLFFSPYSISSALAMTYAGARGETAAEMAKVLGISGLGERVHPAHAQLLRELHSGDDGDGPKTRIANSLWGNQGMAFHDDFLQTAKRHYQAKVSELDFITQPEEAKQTINKWVSRKTEGKIPELLDRRDVSERTKLVLVNAIYFKGMWANAFDPKHTKDDTFQIAPNQSQPVKMMNLGFEGAFHSSDGVKVLWLPYQTRDRHLLLIVPDDMTGLAKFESGLSAKTFEKWKSTHSDGNVSLQLPRMAFRDRRLLCSNLMNMGMRLPFDPKNADFKGISGTEIHVEDVIHEAVIDLDEEGTVAAAATAIITSIPISLPPQLPNVLVRADHPFCFMIIDDKSHMILFMGRLSDPR